MNAVISIVIPVYNVEAYLPQCLESIINQSYPLLQIILIDDGSTDGSGKICDIYKKKDSRIVVIHKENGGVSSARNVGLNRSIGEYILFVDADDYIQTDYCKKLLNLLLEYNADIAGCSLLGTDGCRCFKMDSLSLDTKEIKEFSVCDEKFQFFQWYSINAPFCKIIRRSVIGTLKFDTSLCVGEDLLFYIKVLKKCQKCVCIAEPMYYYYIRENSAMQTQDFNHLFSQVRAWSMVCDELNNNWNARVKAVDKLLYYTYKFVQKEVGRDKFDDEINKYIKHIFRKYKKQKKTLGTGWKFWIEYKFLEINPLKFFAFKTALTLLMRKEQC